MQKTKSESGITLVALTVTVIILLIISSILIYNANDNIYIKRLKGMYNDVSNLRDKVASYYKEYGAIPAKVEYTDVVHLKDAGVIGANDGDKFLVLDLNLLDGITLNFGKDYKRVQKHDYANIDDLKDLYIINEKSHNIFYVEGIQVKDNGTIKKFYTDDENIDVIEVPIIKTNPNVPELWSETAKRDPEWYDYKDLQNNIQNVKINIPILKGNMTPIKYIGPDANTEAQQGSKWANAMTADGSMWVWIPRYAYKITEGYHTNKAGTIEVAFLDTDNRFLNGETGELTVNPEEKGAGLTKWLVHPAFTANANYGGGFGELSGIWVGKFETTGTYSNGDASNVSVKPGISSLRSMTINDQFKAGKNAKYGETVDLKSHMAKNSEWGVVVYLAHSKYGINKSKIEQNKNNSYYTGGTGVISEIYTTNKNQSTTHNATGIYDINGGVWERTAGYLNNGNEQLGIAGGKNTGDLYGATVEEKQTSTEYKTVYSSQNNPSQDYEFAKKYKGDAIYETSESYSNEIGAWNNLSAYFPNENGAFINYGGPYNGTASGSFCFHNNIGLVSPNISFRLILAL